MHLPGSGKLCTNRAEPIENLVGRNVFREHLVISESVLQRNDNSIFADAVFERQHDAVGLRRLNHENNNIHNA